jgi:hypothetical protein
VVLAVEERGIAAVAVVEEVEEHSMTGLEETEGTEAVVEETVEHSDTGVLVVVVETGGEDREREGTEAIG